MSKDANEYYREYYDTLKDDSYTMEKWGDSSRVLFLRGYLDKYTPDGGSILDVGCGDMHLSTVLPQYNWTGIDINTEKAKGHAVTYDLMKEPYPLEDESYDSIVCSEVLEHLWDLRVVHRQVHRLLKPGGFYVISTPNFDWIDHYQANFGQLLFDHRHPHLFEHIRQYNAAVHKRYLEDAGFRVMEVVGADAQYSAFFQGMRNVLMKYLTGRGLSVTIGEVDQLIGMGFPLHNHTVMVTARKV